MQQNWLSNRAFESYDQIVALWCDAWNPALACHVHWATYLGSYMIIKADWYQYRRNCAQRQLRINFGSLASAKAMA